MAGLRLFWPRGRSGLREGPPGLGGRSSRGIAPFGMFPRAGDLLLGGGSNLGGTYGSNLPAVSYMLLGSGEVAAVLIFLPLLSTRSPSIVSPLDKPGPVYLE